jgi:hypothetical protein
VQLTDWFNERKTRRGTGRLAIHPAADTLAGEPETHLKAEAPCDRSPALLLQWYS